MDDARRPRVEEAVTEGFRERDEQQDDRHDSCCDMPACERLACGVLQGRHAPPEVISVAVQPHDVGIADSSAVRDRVLVETRTRAWLEPEPECVDEPVVERQALVPYSARELVVADDESVALLVDAPRLACEERADVLAESTVSTRASDALVLPLVEAAERKVEGRRASDGALPRSHSMRREPRA